MISTFKVLYPAKINLTKYPSVLKDSWPQKCSSIQKLLIKGIENLLTLLLIR